MPQPDNQSQQPNMFMQLMQFIMKLFGMDQAAAAAPATQNQTTPSQPTPSQQKNVETPQKSVSSPEVKPTLTQPSKGKVMLDVGHGGRILDSKTGKELTAEECNKLKLSDITSGKYKADSTGYDGGSDAAKNKMSEFEVNFIHAIAAADKLRDKGFNVDIFVGKDTLDKQGGIAARRARVEHANATKPNYMISFHNNEGGGKSTEVYYPEHHAGKELAQQLKTKINEGGRSSVTHSETATRHKSGLAIFKNHNDPARQMILVEGGFLDNMQDLSKITGKDSSAFIDKYTNAIADTLEKDALAKGLNKSTETQQVASATLSPSNTPHNAAKPSVKTR